MGRGGGHARVVACAVLWLKHCRTTRPHASALGAVSSLLCKVLAYDLQRSKLLSTAYTTYIGEGRRMKRDTDMVPC